MEAACPPLDTSRLTRECNTRSVRFCRDFDSLVMVRMRFDTGCGYRRTKP